MQTREILASPGSGYYLFGSFLNCSSFQSPRKHLEIAGVATEASWGVGFTRKGKWDGEILVCIESGMT